ncbi:MAG: DUF3426 domain-containing protein [Pseudomonadota bacterium]|nr:DUF3426 domain-containing protein [Pseudomonadota bacterium]
MTQSSLQTQCPNCETRFRVTDEQLGIAGGKVRCGNCMKVFNAIDHQVAPPTKPAAAPASKPADNSSEQQAASGTDEEDFVFADNPEEDASEGRYAGSRLTFSDDELSDSFRSFDEPEESGYRDDERADKQDNIDESWAEAMLQDDGRNRKPTTQEPRAPEPETREPEPPAKPAEPAPQQSQDDTAPDREPESEHQPQAQAAGGIKADELSLSMDDDDRVGDPVVHKTRTESRRDNLYQDLRRDPVSVGDGGKRWRTVLWSLVVLALIGVLVAQVTWFQFDRLSAIPQLRPFYEQGCELVGCELDPLVDVSAIESRKLVVRTDPENRSQLIVDAVILNRAGFEQPFPAIALTFSNLNGDVVAQSTFAPDEYLAGDAEALKAMTPETPVRIAISIRDPGRDAVNYNLSFLPARP